jgi:ribonuclease HII
MDCGLLESRLHARGFSAVAGADEVGRGALAGPLVAAAVILPSDVHIEGLRDSKLCTKLQRERLAEQIEDVALAMSIVRVRHDRIDRDGLQRCNLQALRKALKGLDVEPDYALIDGFRLKRLTYPGLAVKKGDAVSSSVAAASIVAKVYRDRAMKRYHRRFPEYGFATNVGYGTREHWDALIRLGPSEIHRLSFYGVTGFPEEGSGEDRRAKRMRQRGALTEPEARDLRGVIRELAAVTEEEMG